MNDVRLTRPKRSLPTRPAQPPPAPRFYARSGRPLTRKFRMPQWLQWLLFVPIITFGSLLIQSVALGQFAVAAYGVVAFFCRIPSRTTFTLALFSMITTATLLVGKGDIALAQNFAVYTFLLLVVGVVTLGRELKQEGGRVYVRRQ